MKIRVSNSLFVILVSAVLWQPVSAAADSYDPPVGTLILPRKARRSDLSYAALSTREASITLSGS